MKAIQVRSDHEAAPVDKVSQHPAQRAEDDNGHDPGRRGDPGPQGRVRPIPDQDDEGQVIEPVADLRNGQGGQQGPEGGIAQRRADRS
jgi:hypothetical protein